MEEPVKAGNIQSFVVGSRVPRDKFNEEAIRYQQSKHANLMDALEELGHPVDRENFSARMHDPAFVEDVRTALKEAHDVPDSSTFYAKYGGTIGTYREPTNQKEQGGYDLAQRATSEALQEPGSYWDAATSMLTPRRLAAEHYENEGTTIPVTAKLAGAIADVGSLPGRTAAGIGSAANVGAREALAKLFGMEGSKDIDLGSDVANAFYQSMASPMGITGNSVGDIGSTMLKDPLGPLVALTGPNLQAPARALAREIGMAAEPTVAREVMLGATKPSVRSKLESLQYLPAKAVEALDSRFNINPALLGAGQGVGVGVGGTALSQAQSSRELNPWEYAASAGAGGLFGGLPAHMLASQQKAVLENFPGQFSARAKEAVKGSNRISKQLNPLDIANILTSVEQPGTVTSYGAVSQAMRNAAKERMNAATEAATRDIIEGRATGLPLTPSAEFQRTGGLRSPAYIQPSEARAHELGLSDQFPLPYEDVGEAFSSDASKPSNLAALLEQHLSGVSAGTPASITKARRDFMSTLSAIPEDRLDFTSPTLMPHNAANIGDITARVRGSAGTRPVDTRLHEILRGHEIADATDANLGLADKFRDLNPKLKAIDQKMAELNKESSRIANAADAHEAEFDKYIAEHYAPLEAQAEKLKKAGKPVPKALNDKMNEVWAQASMVTGDIEQLQAQHKKLFAPMKASELIYNKLFDQGEEAQNAWNNAVAKALGADDPRSLKYPFQVLPADVPWMKRNLNETIRKAGSDSRIQKVDEALAMKDALNQFQESFPSYKTTLGDKANRQWGLAAALDEVLAKHPPNAGTKRVDRGSLLEFIPGIGGQAAKMFSPNTKNYLKNVTGTETQYKLLPEAYRRLESPLYPFLPAFSAYAPSVLPGVAARETTRRVSSEKNR